MRTIGVFHQILPHRIYSNQVHYFCFVMKLGMRQWYEKVNDTEQECFSLFFIGNQSVENIILRFFEILLRKTWMFVEIVLSFWWKHKFTKSTIISQYIYLTKWCIGTFYVFTSIYNWWMFNEKYNSMEKSSIFHQMFRNIMNCRLIIFANIQLQLMIRV